MKSRFGGLAVSKMVKPLPAQNVIQGWYGYYVYSEKDKIMSDPDTSIYFGKMLDNNGNYLDEVVIKMVEATSYEANQLYNENNKLRAISQTNASRYIPMMYEYLPPAYANGKYNLIMQRVGPSIEQISKKKKLSALTCLSIMYQGIEALHALHAENFVHSDIKPGNMCIGLHDPQNLKLIDLGISSIYSTGKEAWPRLENRINGSPYYVSPEIWFGKDLVPVSRKHDLQSLLYTVLELYNGRLPWRDIKLEGVKWEQVPAARKQIADYKETAVVAEIDKIQDQRFVEILINYFRNVWSLGPRETPKYKKLMDGIRRYPGFMRDIVIKPRT
jgi:serine/threonine protein kinase